MSNAGKIFGLNEVYEKKVQDNWTTNFSYGYFVGGSDPAPGDTISLITRIDFISDTFSHPFNYIAQQRHDCSSSQTPQYGYYVRGKADDQPPVPLPSYTCTIERLDYSNETSVDTGSDVPTAYSESSIAQNPSYHFEFGGFQSNSWPGVGNPPFRTHSHCNKFEFSTETSTQSSTNTPFPGGLANLAGTQSSSYGYFAGGYTDIQPPTEPTLYRSTVHKFDFSTESLLTPTADLFTGIRGISAIEDSSFAIFLGGYSSPSTFYSKINKLDFSSETISTPGNDTEIYNYSTVSSNDAGYIISSTPGEVKKYDFSTESISTNPTGFSLQSSSFMGEGTAAGTNIKVRQPRQNYGQIGYLVGGRFPPGSPADTFTKCGIARLDLSSDSYNSSAVTDLPYQIRCVSRLHSSNIDGYIIGNQAPPNGGYSYVTKLNFTSETHSSLDNLSEKRRAYASAQNSSYGYMIGGDKFPSPPPPTNLSSIGRMEFSTDIVSIPPSTLSTELYYAGGIQSQYNAYIIGGITPPNTYDCTIRRMDFSTETFSTLTDGISPGRRSVAAVASSTDAYLAGGYRYITQDTYYSTINKLNFSTDSISSALTSTLPAGRDGIAAMENAEFGYFLGGAAFPSHYNDGTKMEFSNDTGTTYPLPSNVGNYGAIRNSN